MTKFKDLSGLKINKILVLSISRTDNTKKRKIIYYTCQCDCGNIFESNGYSIVRGNTKSCGCIKIKYNPDIGQELNRLVIVSEKYKNKYGNYVVDCKCFCGQILPVLLTNIYKGKTKSCGCIKRDTHLGDISQQFWSKIQRSAGSRQHKFLVSREFCWNLFLKQNRKCAISGLEIYFPVHYRDIISSNYTASLDRIDSSKDYTEDNVQWLHKYVNLMKLDHNQMDFINLCHIISNNNKKE